MTTPRWAGLVSSLLLFAGASAAAPPGLQKNDSLAVMKVSGRGLNVKLLKTRRPFTRQIICRDVHRSSQFEGQLESYSLHPTLALILLRCRFQAHSHGPGEQCLCNTFAFTSKSYLVHVRSKKKIEVRGDFDFSPAKGHALFVGEWNEPITFVPAQNLHLYALSKGHRGGRRKIRLSSVPVDPKSAATSCPQRTNRDHTLTAWWWLADDTLRLHVTYCWRYVRLVDYCPASDSIKMVTGWASREEEGALPIKAPSACSSAAAKSKPAP